jgi:parvulin-like peptidyl-prolyl isomerase
MSLEDFKASVKSKYLSTQVLNREVYGRVQQNITTEELRNFYEAHKKDFDRPAGVHIREIMVNTENMGPAEADAQRKKIDDAVAAIKKGDDFADIASKYSESDTAQSGGDLGFFEKGQLQKELEDVIAKLDKGQISEVIKTTFGFMVIKLEDRHAGGVLLFDSAQNEVYGAMFNEKAVPKVREYLTKLRQDGFVWIKEGYVDSGSVKTPN